MAAIEPSRGSVTRVVLAEAVMGVGRGRTAARAGEARGKSELMITALAEEMGMGRMAATVLGMISAVTA